VNYPAAAPFEPATQNQKSPIRTDKIRNASRTAAALEALKLTVEFEQVTATTRQPSASATY